MSGFKFTCTEIIQNAYLKKYFLTPQQSYQIQVYWA